MADKNKNSNLATLLLGATAVVCTLGAMGTEEYREEITIANKQAGKEIYSDKDMSSQSETTALAIFGASCFVGAFASACRKER